MSNARRFMIPVIILIVFLSACGGAPAAATPEPATAADAAAASPLPRTTETATARPTATPIPATPHPPTPTTAPTDAPPTEPAPTEAPSPAVAPTRGEPLAVAATKGLAFAVGARGDEWLLDEYAPEAPGPWPLVVFLHGSGQSRFIHESLGRALAQEGFAVSIIDYPDILPDGAILGRALGYRGMSDTADCALRFARERAAARGDDAPKAILSGFSLGAAVGAQVALAGEDLDALWSDFEATGGAPRQVTCLATGDDSGAADAFIGVAGIYDTFVGYGSGVDFLEARDPDLLAMLQRLPGLNPGVVLRLLHGADDNVVDPEASADLAALLRETGQDVQVITFDGSHAVPLELFVATMRDVAAILEAGPDP